ncbi:hypothetical protein GGR56DRAFT_526971 [Xylariaceae sp. FL0804]|nr:hypothetical protein GGR56DRAFT_526971 [Xylariaceae sp. FL0804]
MRFSTSALSLVLAAASFATAIPAAEPVAERSVEDADLVPRNTECGQDFIGAATCTKNCANGHCHVIALGPLHKCKC